MSAPFKGFHGRSEICAQLLLDRVGFLTGGRPLLRRQSGDGSQELGENALAAEIMDLQRLNFLRVSGSRLQFPPCFRINLVQIQFHDTPNAMRFPLERSGRRCGMGSGGSY